MRSILVIAGSDPGGGAGLQGDIKTATLHGVFAMAVPSCLTVQNTCGVTKVYDVSPLSVFEQIDNVLSDHTPDCVKIGLLPSREIITAVADALRGHNLSNIVIDPVGAPTRGVDFHSDKGGWRETLLDELTPLCDYITPNLPEAFYFAGDARIGNGTMNISRRQTLDLGIEVMKRSGCRCGVILKGGHREDSPVDSLIQIDPSSRQAMIDEFPSEFIKSKNTHGTGCAFSTAMACGLALGMTAHDAVRNAKSFVRESMALSADDSIGHGNGPLWLLPR